nr:PLD nuclease N-terminal domain-containing protein [Leifsonia psychrotolerans]
MKKKQRWEDLSPSQKVATVVAGTIQIALALSAWVDLAQRPADEVNGPKGLWGVLIAVNFIGPIAYFVGGRRRSS